MEFGEAPVTMGVGPVQRAPAEQIKAVADAMWRAVSSSGVAAGDAAGNDQMLADMRREGLYRDFICCFPVVARYMVQARQWNRKAFATFLTAYGHAADRGIETREEFLRIHGEYVVQLMRRGSRRRDEAGVRAARERVQTILATEDAIFMEAQREAETETALEEAAAAQRLRGQLRDYIMSLHAERAAAAAAAAAATPAAAPPAAAGVAPAEGAQAQEQAQARAQEQ